jgi:hypothetical protein
LSKGDQKEAKDDIDDKYKSQVLTKEKEITEADKKVAALLASTSNEE